jgi:hypothetical protein
MVAAWQQELEQQRLYQCANRVWLLQQLPPRLQSTLQRASYNYEEKEAQPCRTLITRAPGMTHLQHHLRTIMTIRWLIIVLNHLV